MKRKGEAAPEVREYRTFADDFVESPDQDLRLPDDYTWVDESRSFRAQAKVARALGWVVSEVYCRLMLGLRIEGRERIDEVAREGGCFLYGNHTQPVGDACIPLLAAHPRRDYVVVSPSNFAVPVFGRFLKQLGALPVADDAAGTRQLLAAVKTRLAQGHVVTVYPEGHLWPWHMNIRPLPTSAFTLPVSANRPVFAMTNTYHARKGAGKPCCTVYIDGPFYPDPALPRARRKEKLRDEVQAAMMARAATSDCAYIRYVPAEGAPAMPASNGTAAAPGAAPYVAEVVEDDPGASEVISPAAAASAAARMIAASASASAGPAPQIPQIPQTGDAR